jgi:hypothetical protein
MLSSKYIQGQINKKDQREYFYYLDHQGQVYIFSKLQQNSTTKVKFDFCQVIFR